MGLSLIGPYPAFFIEGGPVPPSFPFFPPFPSPFPVPTPKIQLGSLGSALSSPVGSTAPKCVWQPGCTWVQPGCQTHFGAIEAQNLQSTLINRHFHNICQ